MNILHQEQTNRILNLVREIEKLNDVERLLLYLQLPCGRAELPEGKYKNASVSCTSGPQKQSTDIFSKKSDQETTKTYTWILSHLEEDPNVSLPKQEVYDEYRAFCQANRFEPLCVADFGKAMKHALPCIKPRRLGQRGNSRYCYSGLRKKYKLEVPSLPNILQSCDLQSGPTSCSSVSTEHHFPNANKMRCAKPLGFLPGCQYECPTLSCPSKGINRGRPNTCGKIMNLKIEPCSLSQACVVSSGSLPNCCSATSSVQTIMSSPTMIQVQTGSEQQQQQQQQHQYQPHSVPASPMSIGPQHYSGQQAGSNFAHRYGTPDDDDYGHNYQDLNRPIVNQAAGIPFSQTIHAQLAQQPAENNSFTSYDNPQAQAPPPTMSVNHHHQHQHHHPQLQQQQQQQQRQQTQRHQHPHDPRTINKQHDVGNQHQSMIANACCREAPKISTNGNDNDASHVNADTHCASVSSNQHQAPEINDDTRLITQQHHQPEAQNDSHLHINLSLLDHSVCSNMEYCTSPFQSPASTPYPSMSNYPTATSAQDTHDYFSTDCSIQYSDH